MTSSIFKMFVSFQVHNTLKWAQLYYQINMLIHLAPNYWMKPGGAQFVLSPPSGRMFFFLSSLLKEGDRNKWLSLFKFTWIILGGKGKRLLHHVLLLSVILIFTINIRHMFPVQCHTAKVCCIVTYCHYYLTVFKKAILLNSLSN